MIQPTITISLLPSKPNVPFVLGPDLATAVASAANHGFPAFELFPPNLETIDIPLLKQLCDQYSIKLSTIGTGGGWVSQGLSLTDESPEKRAAAVDYIRSIIQIAADFGGAAIIGSMQGRCGQRDREATLPVLRDALGELAEEAQGCGQPLLYEPLNRYETDWFNSVMSTADFLAVNGLDNVKILADLFHMNIEEIDPPVALQSLGHRLGHVHFVDSNRRIAGMGHTDFEPIVAALKNMDYNGYLGIEAFPLPNQDTAASEAMAAHRKWFA